MNKNTHENIYLIGMMGSGKSTIGRLLCKELNRTFIDTDDKIEEFMGYTIKEIFASMGESRFREMEESYFIEKSQHSELIISTGGGIILSQKNREILQKATNVFYLKADPPFLITRLNKRYKRPLLAGNEPLLPKVEKIYNSRNQFYENCAKHIINIETLSKSEKVNKILNCLK